MRFIFFLFIISVSAKSQKAFKWPGNKKAAIVLTYDDALQSQLDIAIPQLNSFHFKGTFFLTGTLTEKDIVRWRNAAKNGHELGNHTLFHPCSGSVIPSASHYRSETYSAAIILREISVMNNFLFEMITN